MGWIGQGRCDGDNEEGWQANYLKCQIFCSVRRSLAVASKFQSRRLSEARLTRTWKCCVAKLWCCAEEKSRHQTTWALGRPRRLTGCQVAVPSTKGVGGWERKKRGKETTRTRRRTCKMLNYISYIVDRTHELNSAKLVGSSSSTRLDLTNLPAILDRSWKFQIRSGKEHIRNYGSVVYFQNWTRNYALPGVSRGFHFRSYVSSKHLPVPV